MDFSICHSSGVENLDYITFLNNFAPLELEILSIQILSEAIQQFEEIIFFYEAPIPKVEKS